MKRWRWMIVGLVFLVLVVLILSKPLFRKERGITGYELTEEEIKEKAKREELEEGFGEQLAKVREENKALRESFSLEETPKTDAQIAQRVKRDLKQMEQICIETDDFEALMWDPRLLKVGTELDKMGKAATPQLIAALQDRTKNKDFRFLLVDLICSIGDERAIEPLRKIMEDPSEDIVIRTNIADRFWCFEDSRAVDTLIDALYLPEKRIRQRATISLGKMGDKRAVDPLLTALEDDERKDIWHSAVGTLGKLGDEKAVDPLIEAMEKEKSDASFALVNIGGPKAIDAVIEHCKKKRNTYTVQALGRIKDDPRAVDLLIEALKDKNGSIVWDAVTSLGEIGDERAVEPLEEALQATDRRSLKRIIAMTLKKITGKDYEY